MVHTLVEHMGTVFPNPWDLESTVGSERVQTASTEEVRELVNEVDSLLLLSTKLTRQLVRTHNLLGTGKDFCSQIVANNILRNGPLG